MLLCDGCVEVCNEIVLSEGVTTDARATSSDSLTISYSLTSFLCSLCGEREDRVVWLIAMLNDLFLCNMCVGVCNAGVVQALVDVSELERKGGE